MSKYTWIPAIIGGMLALLMTRSTMAVMGAELVILGAFLSNYADANNSRFHPGIGGTLLVLGLIMLFMLSNMRYLKGFKDGVREGLQRGFIMGTTELPRLQNG